MVKEKAGESVKARTASIGVVKGLLRRNRVCLYTRDDFNTLFISPTVFVCTSECYVL